jgi:hypothetical protein
MFSPPREAAASCSLSHSSGDSSAGLSGCLLALAVSRPDWGRCPNRVQGVGVDHCTRASPIPSIFFSSRHKHHRPLRPSYTREGVAVEPYAIQTAGCGSGAASTVAHSPSPTVRQLFTAPLGMSTFFCDVSHRVSLRLPHILLLGSDECRLQRQIFTSIGRLGRFQSGSVAG